MYRLNPNPFKNLEKFSLILLKILIFPLNLSSGHSVNFGPKIKDFAFFSEMIRMILLIIHMKLSFDKGQWVNKPKISKNSSSAKIAQIGQIFGPKSKI